MIWLFLSVVLFLAVIHEGFRKIALWVGAAAIAATVLFAIAIY
jgi:hypothetical protein